MLKRKVLEYERLYGGRNTKIRRFHNYMCRDMSTKHASNIEGGYSLRDAVNQIKKQYPLYIDRIDEYVDDFKRKNRIQRSLPSTAQINQLQLELIQLLTSQETNETNETSETGGTKDQGGHYDETPGVKDMGSEYSHAETPQPAQPTHPWFSLLDEELDPRVRASLHRYMKRNWSAQDVFEKANKYIANLSSTIEQNPDLGDALQPELYAYTQLLNRITPFTSTPTPSSDSTNTSTNTRVDEFLQLLRSTVESQHIHCDSNKTWIMAQMFNPDGKEGNVHVALKPGSGTNPDGFAGGGGGGYDPETIEHVDPNHSIKHDANENKFRFTFAHGEADRAIPLILHKFNEFLTNRPTCIYFKIMTEICEGESQCGKDLDFYLSDMTFMDAFLDFCTSKILPNMGDIKADNCMMATLSMKNMYQIAQANNAEYMQILQGQGMRDGSFTENMDRRKIEHVIAQNPDSSIKFSFRNEVIGLYCIENSAHLVSDVAKDEIGSISRLYTHAKHHPTLSTFYGQLHEIEPKVWNAVKMGHPKVLSIIEGIQRCKLGTLPTLP